jgi:hypothetical protein
VIKVGEGSTPECPGSAENPEAEPGNLCVYETVNIGETKLQVSNSIAGGLFGATLFSGIPDESDYEFDGTWAVTAK